MQLYSDQAYVSDQDRNANNSIHHRHHYHHMQWSVTLYTTQQHWYCCVAVAGHVRSRHAAGSVVLSARARGHTIQLPHSQLACYTETTWYV